MSKILFIQFSNSGAYPPIQNAVSLCLLDGHDVNVLCVASEGSESLRFPDKIEKITRRLPRSSGRLGLVFLYFRFMALVFWKVFTNRSQWLYASDPMSAPAAYYAKKIFGCRVIYHEHDAPPAPNNRFQSFVNRARLELANISDAVVMPNADRMRLFLKEADCPGRKNAFTAWNCPLKEEIISTARERHSIAEKTLSLYFHGSISPSLLPIHLLAAIKSAASGITLTMAGYPTDGGLYLRKLMDEAQHLGIAERVLYLGPFSRQALLPLCAEHDVGICFYDPNPGLINHRYMAGASNKPFDYLSQGLLLLISDTPEQRALFDGLECARFCDSDSVESITAALTEIIANTALRLAARRRGPSLIEERWNYSAQFKPVLNLFRL
jgi:glycosyltransferase involved in cell wall biosynthesis